MKITSALIAAILLMAAGSDTLAQSSNSRIITTITTEKHATNYSMGRDFWFSPAQNYVDEPGKYIRLFISSPNNTTAYVEDEGIVRAIAVQSYGLATFDVPLE